MGRLRADELGAEFQNVAAPGEVEVFSHLVGVDHLRDRLEAGIAEAAKAGDRDCRKPGGEIVLVGVRDPDLV